jgi:hypothetical protein
MRLIVVFGGNAQPGLGQISNALVNIVCYLSVTSNQDIAQAGSNRIQPLNACSKRLVYLAKCLTRGNASYETTLPTIITR